MPPWAARWGGMVMAAALTALAGCAERLEPGGASAPVSAEEAQAALSLEVQAAVPACTGTGAHDTHAALPGSCQTCHPCGGALGLAPGATLPSGRPLAGTITRAGAGATCTVACHTPPGGTAPTMAWSGHGPLPCTACHGQGGAVPAGGSSHPAASGDVAAVRASCQGCHELSRHVTGRVRVDTGAQVVETALGGTAELNAVCEGCHLGQGRALAGRSPPMLVGWTDPAGDFHGARAGTGSGGTLAAPYVRGQAPLACTACHDPHVSGNAFLFRDVVNGQDVAGGTVGRAGVGAERLCAGCHLGERHAMCLGCHAADPQPAGSACLACHGHEGIRGFPWPQAIPHGSHGPPPGATGDCAHCHDTSWVPVPEARAPVLGAVSVTGVTGSAATLAWTTDEAATGWVEFGLSDHGLVTGDAALSRAHSVQLGGLAGPATYQFRVRSADRFRNVAQSATGTFQTADAAAPTAPVPDAVADVWTWSDAEPVALTWQPATSPLGHAVQHRAVVVQYGATMADSGWISGTAFTPTLPAAYYPDSYGWRVMARDAVTQKTSPWSDAGVFGVWWY